MPLPFAIPAFATTAAKTVLANIPDSVKKSVKTAVKDAVREVTTSLTPYLPDPLVNRHARTNNALIIPAGLVGITRAIYFFARNEYHEDAEALHNLAVIHYDGDLYSHVDNERDYLPVSVSAEEDVEEARKCLVEARKEIKRAFERGLPGDADGLMLNEFDEILAQIEKRERERTVTRMIIDADLVDVEERIWIERMADQTDELVMEGDALMEEMEVEERKEGMGRTRLRGR